MTTNPTDAQMKLALECAEKAAAGYLALPLPADHPLVQSALLAIQATEARAQVLVDALEACSQWMSDVFPLLGPLKEEWKQADMWSDYDEEVFNRRATLNLHARQALATWRRT